MVSEELQQLVLSVPRRKTFYSNTRGEHLSWNLEPPRQPALEHDHDQQERTANEVLPEELSWNVP